jgi:nitrogen-specific signal transduction histidine kinase
VIARVNAQEIKQVVLNLITNALDSLDARRHVPGRLAAHRGGASELVVRDNGCGMTEKCCSICSSRFSPAAATGRARAGPLDHLSHRQDHGGEIEAVQRRTRPRFAFPRHVALGGGHEEKSMKTKSSRLTAEDPVRRRRAGCRN